MGCFAKPQYPISEIVSSANRRRFTHGRGMSFFMPTAAGWTALGLSRIVRGSVSRKIAGG
jgi:hypothetical protein